MDVSDSEDGRDADTVADGESPQQPIDEGANDVGMEADDEEEEEED